MVDQKPVRERACYVQMMGAWAIDPGYLDGAMATVHSVGVDAILAKAEATPVRKHNVAVYAIGKSLACAGCDEPPADDADPGYVTAQNGTAIIAIHGPISKRESSSMAMFGGTSTANVREALATALADTNVKRIMLHVDSPGGTVSGVGDLADDLRAARGKKPIMAYIEDLGASAAYWLAAQANSIYASPHAEIGSIGVYSAIYDESEAFAKAGVKPIVFRSTKLKGGMVAGEKPSQEFIDAYQKNVDATNTAFVKAIATGRRVATAKANSWATAELWRGEEAAKMGLIDGVATAQEAFARFSGEATPPTAASSPKTYQAQADSISSGVPKMPDPPTAADLVAMEDKVASMNAALSAEKQARLEAEKNAAAVKLQLDAIKAQADADHVMVAQLKKDALNKEANEAALGLVKAGKVPAEAVSRFADRYVKYGKEEFEAMAADLPVRHVGATEAPKLIKQDASADERRTVLAEIDAKRFGAKANRKGA